ncbi:hypothetical protein Syun_004936 [Stephania yunnanensis]|uniref:Uncharacterized protein n=1 Tax=Stephania yunnanensis TaxID=152371 RepID=A0AAP0Q2Z9_9MAGN
MESWESLITGAPILKGTSVYIVGDSTEINEKVARELAVMALAPDTDLVRASPLSVLIRPRE